jgi:hypothetical protein
MPQTKETTQTATTYPTVEQYERWKAEADKYDMSMSEFIQNMTEAGMKEFTRETSEEEFYEVRRQRKKYFRRLKEKENKIQNLEQQLNQTMRGDILDYIQENPGASHKEVVQYLINEVPDQVRGYLQNMIEEGSIREQNERYYFDAES